MDEVRRHDKKIYNDLVEVFTAIPGVSVVEKKEGDRVFSRFTVNEIGSHAVEVYYIDDEDEEVCVTGIDIEGADTDYWNTSEVSQSNYEETNLDMFIPAAISSLTAKVKFNTSPVFRYKEICFEEGDKWLCTRIEGDYRFHYTATRKLN